MAIIWASLYLFFATFAKRLHDFNANAAFGLVVFPFFYIGVLILALVPGDKGKNRFGEPRAAAGPSDLLRSTPTFPRAE